MASLTSPKAVPKSPNHKSPSLKSLSNMTVTVEASPCTSLSRALEGVTPSLHKSGCKASSAERHFAFDTACQCVEEAQQAKSAALQHALYFEAQGFRVLKDALLLSQRDDETDVAEVSSSTASAETTESQWDSQLKDTASSSEFAHKRKLGLWKSIKRRLSAESTKQLQSPQKGEGALRRSPSPMGQSQPAESERTFDFVSVNAEKAFGLLVAAAPFKGEVQHWVWLLRAFMDKCGIVNVHVMLSYLARVANYIAPEEEWLRLLQVELTPVLAFLRSNDLPPSSQEVLRTVADRAMLAGEEAMLGYRSHRSSRRENAELLTAAIRLQVLVAKCASAADCTDMSGLFEELLTSAAHQRFRSLISRGVQHAGGSGHREAKDVVRSVRSLAGICEQLVQDIIDDEECYQPAFPADCTIDLPAISCRVYCNLLRTELGLLLQHTPNPDRSFFALFSAVHQLELKTLQWAPSTLGPAGSLCNGEGRLLFLPHIESWMRGVRSKLMQWSMRLLKEEVWQNAAAAGSAGLRCSPSLVELFRALCSVAEDNSRVSAAHTAYASLMERTLSKVVLVHVAGLERLCQAEMPKAPHKLASQLRTMSGRNGRSADSAREPFQPSSTLCMLLNDLREIRSKQADLGIAVRSSLPPEWWGRSSEAGLREKMRLGDRFKLCQVEIERRYAAVLHHTVKRMMEGMVPLLSEVLMQQGLEDVPMSTRMQPLTDSLDSSLRQLTPLLDARVLRRVARELWNSFAGCLHDDLLESQDNRENGPHQSLGNVGSRIQHTDGILKCLSEFIITHPQAGLSHEDEPEKVTKLRRMLALFMREDEGRSVESL